MHASIKYTMYVVLDTNIIFSDFHLTGAKITALCTSIELIGGEVCVPEIVVMESINKYKEELIANKKRIDKELNAFSRLTQQAPFINPITDEFVERESSNMLFI